MIEAGFAAASPGDLEAIRAVGQQIEGPIVASLSRCTKGDIAAAWEALKDAPRRRCHVFLATSPIHRDFKLKLAKEEIIKRAVDGVKLAREQFEDVEFSAEDSARTELEFLAEVVERVIEAGAGTVNIPDTVGYALPPPTPRRSATSSKHVRGIDKVVVSVHCHNDLGLAVANSLAGVWRARGRWSAPSTASASAPGTRRSRRSSWRSARARTSSSVRTGVKTERLYPTSRLVSQVTGLHVQRNKAIVGQNAFAHEAGIHQHGMLTHRETYEIMRPEEVGLRESQLVLGKHSGRHALKERLVALGYKLDDAADRQGVRRLQGPRRQEEGHLRRRHRGARRPRPDPRQGRPCAWELEALSTTSGTGTLPCASIALRRRDGARVRRRRRATARSTRSFKAIEKITGITREAPRLPDCERLDRRGRAGRGSIEVEHATGVLPRPRALHRHHRGLARARSSTCEPHRAQERAGATSEAAAPRWGPRWHDDARRARRCSRRSGTRTSSGRRRRRRPPSSTSTSTSCTR